jgi:hypothetical protein
VISFSDAGTRDSSNSLRAHFRFGVVLAGSFLQDDWYYIPCVPAIDHFPPICMSALGHLTNLLIVKWNERKKQTGVHCATPACSSYCLLYHALQGRSTAVDINHARQGNPKQSTCLFYPDSSTQ